MTRVWAALKKTHFGIACLSRLPVLVPLLLGSSGREGIIDQRPEEPRVKERDKKRKRNTKGGPENPETIGDRNPGFSTVWPSLPFPPALGWSSSAVLTLIIAGENNHPPAKDKIPFLVLLSEARDKASSGSRVRAVSHHCRHTDPCDALSFASPPLRFASLNLLSN